MIFNCNENMDCNCDCGRCYGAGRESICLDVRECCRAFWMGIGYFRVKMRLILIYYRFIQYLKIKVLNLMPLKAEF